MKRVLEREWLDELDPLDQEAVQSRLDLRRLNRLMGHARILADLLSAASSTPSTSMRLVELGGGDAWLSLQLAQRLAVRWPRAEVVLVDQSDVVAPQTREEFDRLGWKLTTVTADVPAWLSARAEPADAIFANLFLHHFPDDQLKSLLALASKRTKLFAATEPRRGAVPLLVSHLVGCIGCHRVTRHDAVASVRAGFAGQELSALWHNTDSWQFREGTAGFATHTFLAVNTSPFTSL
jgi:hypothetical protein